MTMLEYEDILPECVITFIFNDNLTDFKLVMYFLLSYYIIMTILRVYKYISDPLEVKQYIPDPP